MARLKRINPISMAVFQAVLFAHLGLAAGILYAFGGLIYDLLTIGPNFGTLLAFGALIGMPVIFAAFGLVLGAIEALLYNLIGGRLGGLEYPFDK